MLYFGFHFINKIKLIGTYPTFAHYEIAEARMTVAVTFHAYVTVLMIGTIDEHLYVSPGTFLAGHSCVSLGTFACFDQIIGFAIR